MKRLLSALVGATALSLLAAVPASADHRWNTYHWARSANPLRLEVIDSVTSFWQSEFGIALNEWASSDVINLTVTGADENRTVRRQCPAVIGKMRVCNEAYGRNGWLGLATIGLDARGHIDRGTAKMNDTYSSYWTIAGEKRHVMCQEIGHVFGLGHTSEDGSVQDTCMDYSTSLTSQSPNAHDYQELSEIYAHLDTYNSFTAGGGSAAAANAKSDLPPGVPNGALLTRKNKHEEVYVKGRDDGGYWVFHVRLAPDERHDGHEHEH